MTILWLVTGAALVVALAAFRRARRTARKLEELTQLYWELHYHYRALHQAPSQGLRVLTPPPQRADPAAFVPLASLRR